MVSDCTAWSMLADHGMNASGIDENTTSTDVRDAEV
jgi:hypothetical protein